MSRILVLSAHRNPDISRLNQALITALRPLEQVTMHELTREYPDFTIDVAREQALLQQHDVLLLLFPFYWYSSPAILKEWQDAVLARGFAYGPGGTQMEGKTLQLVVTTGGKPEAYTPSGYNRYPVEDLLLPFHGMANRVGMNYLPPLLIQGAYDISEQQLADEVEEIVAKVRGLIA